MDFITTLPNEVLHHIMRDVEIVDCASLSLSCRALRNFIRDNKPLFRELYLKKFDEPSPGQTNGEIAWEEELHKLVKLERIMGYASIDQKIPYINTVAETISQFLQNASRTAPSKTIDLLLSHFLDTNDKAAFTNNQEAFLCQSTIFNRARIPSIPSPMPTAVSERQASAKLHCLYGSPILKPRPTHFEEVYPYACSVVYDMRNYTDENLWGPYLPDGRATVDWERIEAVMIVIGKNLGLFTENTSPGFAPIWQNPFEGAVPESFEPITLTCKGLVSLPKTKAHLALTNSYDPYNISGSWMRVVCFLDFHELHHYNFGDPDPGIGNPRPPINTQEAIRMIRMELTVTTIAHAGDPDGPGPNEDPKWPIVCFTGTSRSMHAQWDSNANSNIRGRVSMTKEGYTRWTTWSIYWGEERWKSEGIQIGGVGSGRGILGHWFDKNLSDEGPAGPTAFWKMSNEFQQGDENSDSAVDPDFDEDEDTEEEYENDDDEDDEDNEDDEELHLYLQHHIPAHLVLVSGTDSGNEGGDEETVD